MNLSNLDFVPSRYAERNFSFTISVGFDKGKDGTIPRYVEGVSMEADWLEYEWDWDGRPAIYRVDMRYHGVLPVLRYPYRIKLVVYPAADVFSAAEMKQADALARKVREILAVHGVFVGSVLQPNRMRLFFYTKSEEAAQLLPARLKGETKLRTRVSHAEEEDYAAYYQLLFPDDCKLQSIDNALLLKGLNRSDEECALVHKIYLELAFAALPMRDAFCTSVQTSCFWLEELFTSDHKTHPHCAVVRGFCPLLLQDLNRFTSRAISMAGPLDGVLAELRVGV